MKLYPLRLFPLAGILLASTALGQGDSCATGTSIAGSGSFLFQTSTLGTSGFSGSGSCASGSTTIFQDGFFEWTVLASGDYQFDTLGSSFDTKLSVHFGLGCQALCVGYNDDAGVSVQSVVTVAGLNLGDTLLLQVGGAGSASGMGTLNIGFDPCTTTMDDGFEENDFCSQAAPITVGSHPNLFVSQADTDFYIIQVPAGFELDVDLVDATSDVDFRVLSNTCGLIQTEFDDWTYINSGATSQMIRFEAYVDPAGVLPCSIYELEIDLQPQACNLQTALDDSFEENDFCSTAVSLVAGMHPGLYVHDLDEDFYRVTLPPTSFVSWAHVVTNGSSVDFDLYSAACGFLQTEFADFEYYNTTSQPMDLIVGVRNASGTQMCAEYDLDLSIALDPCSSMADDGLEQNDSCSNARPIHNATYPGLFVTKSDPDHYRMCIEPGFVLRIDVLFSDAIGDLDIYLWEASNVDCGQGPVGMGALSVSQSVTDNEGIVLSNPTTSTLDVILEVRVFTGSTGACNTYDLILIDSGDCGEFLGTTFCDPMDPNSTGQATRLTGRAGSGTGTGLNLIANAGPPQEFGYVLLGTGVSEPGQVFSQGRLCLATSSGQAVGRYNVTGSASLNSVGRFNASGEFENLVGTSTLGTGFDVPSVVPIPGFPPIAAGQTWYFQLWHREFAGQSNFSNVLAVDF